MITLENLKSYLDITGNGEDSKLQPLLDGVLAFLEREYKIFPAKEITEYYNWDGTRKIFLKFRPFNTLTSVHVKIGPDDRSPAETVEEYKDMGMLHVNFNMPKGYNNIRIIYNAGYTPFPDDVNLATLQLCAYQYRSIGLENIQSERVDDVQIVYGKENQTALNLLAPYKKL